MGFGELERWAIYFRELGRTRKYFKGAGEQGKMFGVLGSREQELSKHMSGSWGKGSFCF